MLALLLTEERPLNSNPTAAIPPLVKEKTNSFLLQAVLSQCTIDNFCHERARGFFRQSVSQTTIDKRHFKNFDTIVRNVGHESYVFNIKLTVGFRIRIDLAEKLQFVLIEILTHFLHHPDVAKEFSTQVSVAHHCLTNHIQMGVD